MLAGRARRPSFGAGAERSRGPRARRREGAPPDGLAGVLGLEHRGVAGFLEDLAHQPVDAGEAQLDDDRSVASLLHHPARLARPARPLGETHTRAARRLHLARAQPAVDLRRGVDLRPRLERLLGDRRALDPVQAEVAHAVALGVERRDVPALAPVRQRIGLDPAQRRARPRSPCSTRARRSSARRSRRRPGAPRPSHRRRRARPAGPAPSGPRRAPRRSSRARR